MQLAMWKCNSCGGTYNEHGSDGTVYMHACPPTIPDGAGGQKPTPNPRDESVTTNNFGIGIGIRLVGAGVVPMSGQTTTEPSWIVKMRTAAAALPPALQV